MTPPPKAHIRLACALAVALLLLCVPAAGARANAHPAHPAHPKHPVLSTYATRALLAYQAMQQNFYVPGTGLYRGEPEYSFLWPFSQALGATVSLSHISRSPLQLGGALSALMVGLQQYLSPLPAPAAEGGEGGEGAAAGETTAAGQPTGGATVNATGASTATTVRSYDDNVAPPVGPGGASYYDDNEWVGIELARLYELDRDPAALQQAEQIMAFVMAGWQTAGPGGQPLPCPGGVPFSNAKGNTARNTVTDGPGAELAVQLYRITHENRYL